jgi:hypothetical protein
MSGFRQLLSAHIGQIRNDLRERYKGGFPILKELLQNADDAGGGVQGANASEVVFLLTHGIPNAQHVLLRTPGLCLLNDGDFTATDADSISSYGSSIRGSQAATVGRFGLGLKSVFHWAEAFFYFSSANFEQQDKGSPPFDLLHPWISRETGQGFHKDWDEQWLGSGQCDRHQFEVLVRFLMKSNRWFGLWIPFRARHLLNGVDPLLPEWPADIAGSTLGGLSSYDALFGSGWESRIVEVLPLLRRLRRVRFCAQEAGTTKTILDFTVGEGSQRMRFLTHGNDPLQPGIVNLTGEVSVLKDDAIPQRAGFRGIEKVPPTASAVGWQEHRFWPRPFVQTENGGEEARPDKAAEHGAVLFVRQRGTKNQVRVQSAVFLPLGEPETHSIKGEWSYGLFLHGHFFVDSGRRDIEQVSDLPPETNFETTVSQEVIRKLWNRTLMREVVAPLVLPSLEAFVQQEGMGPAEIEALVEVLARSETLEKNLSCWMYCGQRFIHRLQKDGCAWIREAWAVSGGKDPRWLRFPQPDFPETELFELLPALGHLCGVASVSFEGKPWLADDVPVKPSDEELAGLLGAVAASVFQNAPHLAYLLKLIPQDAIRSSQHSLLTIRFAKLAGRWVNHRLPKDKELRDLWLQFFNLLPAKAFIRLPCDSTKVVTQIASFLGSASLPVALLWQDFHQAEGDGALAWDQVAPLLRQLGGLKFTEEAAIKQRSDIVVRLLKAHEGQTTDWLAAIAAEPLFHVRETGGQTVSVSASELQTAHGEERLFTGGEGWAKDLAKAATVQKPLFVDGPVAKLIGISTSACDGTHCVKLLRRSTQLAVDFASRQPLFDQLIGSANRSSDPSVWAALRCLIHGQIAHFNQTDCIFRESGDQAAFVALTKMALEAAGQTWRLIPKRVADQLTLNAEREFGLGLVPTSASHVEALVKEVDPETVDCAGLSLDDCDVLLHQFTDIKVLRGLNIHETVDGSRCRIGTHSYVNDGEFTDLPEQFDDLVTQLQDRPGYERFADTDESNRLVNKLSWEAVLEIALDQTEPSHWWSTILTASSHLGNRRVELRNRVREISWLPQSHGTPVAPSVLLHVPGADAELDRLPDSVLAGLVPLRRLKDEVQNHPSFGKFKSKILPPAKEEIALLATRLKSHSTYSTGLTGEWSAEQANEWVQTLGLAGEELSNELPIAALVKVLNGEKSVQEYLPAFLKDVGGTVGSAAYAAILKHLAAGHQDSTIEARPLFEQLFLRYLNAVAACGVDFTQTVIRTDGVRLLSAGQQWKSPSLLTFATASIHADDRLDPRLKQTLRLIEPTAPDWITILGAQPHHTSRQTDAELAQQLRQFFSPWKQADLVPDPVGAFLSLLGAGPAMLSLARDFFTTSSRTAVLDWIEQMDRSGFVPLNQRLESTHFEVETVSGPYARVVSVLGTVFQARLAQGFDTLLVDDGLQVDFEQEPILCRLHLRCLPIRTEMPSDESMIAALQLVTQHVLRHALRRDVDIGPLFEELSRANQVHVRIAQNLIVDAALAFLRQIGAQQNPDVQRVLLKWDEARRQVAEAEENNRPVSLIANKLLQNSKLELREILATNLVTQSETLAGVRRKIGEFHYTCSSIPFEIWQNADDAIIDLERLGVEPNRATELGFIVMHLPDGITFSHWGRPINQFQGSAGLNLRGAGFDRDLEKMLVQAISDKGDAVQQGGKALTGKFGLGFKSVFLASDAPEILSGCVDFVIRGGIYPVRLQDGRRNELLSSLEAIAPADARRGTIIRLPLRTDGGTEVNELLGLFTQMAPVLVIFSRRLKRLRFTGEGGNERELIWRPKPILGDQFEFGKLPESLGNLDDALTLLSTAKAGEDRLTLLLGLNSDGFAPLPSHIPAFWVTAPTRETPDYGFAVNGPFVPDVGRVQLARESEKNKRLAKDVSELVCTRFVALWNWAESDWEAFRGELDLCAGASKDSFWGSLWRVLGVHFSEKCRFDDNSVVAELARCILWGAETGGMRHFYTACAALPTGLWGKYRALARIGEVQFLACGALDRKVVFDIISGWIGFQGNVAVGTICSGSQVGSVFERVGAPFREAEVIHLATVVEWELGTEKRADPELASYLGKLITPEFLTGLEKGPTGEREEREHTRIVELLQGVSFQAAEGSWHKAGRLVVAAPQSGVEQDEPMRAAFAPRECQLNPDYTGTALKFFLSSRPRLEAGVEQMAEWVLKAEGDETRTAALRYLLKGGLKERLAEALRVQRDDANWLWQLSESGWFQARFTAEEQHQIRAYILRLFDDALREQTLPSPVYPPQPVREPLHVWTVKELWKWWEQRRMPMDDYTLEGEANWPLFHGGPIGSTGERREELKCLLLSVAKPDGNHEGNALWYRLFGYACLLSAGRQATELRDFWKERLSPNRFWERTSAGDFSEETKKLFTQAVTAQFTDLNAGGEAAYFWRRVFYDVRKIRRMVCENYFPATLMGLVESGRGPHLPHFLRTGFLPGPDQSRWVGTFGQSAGSPLFFVIRELVRLEVITDPAVRPLAYFVSTPVRRALRKIGWMDEDDTAVPKFEELASLSEWLHNKIMEDQEFGPKLLPYFDIPLLHMGITHRGARMPAPPL